jgi:uncharacterized phage protein (TIGR01671 family)
MREIKFRGKHITTGEWLYGSHYDDCGEEYILPNMPGSAVDYEDYQVDPNTVDQYTGLKDKNGKEIYEGDVVQNGEGGYFYIVYWWDEDAAFRGKQVGSSSTIGLNYWRKELRIVGNIYDNPELLQYKPAPPKRRDRHTLLPGEFRIKGTCSNGCMCQPDVIYVARWLTKADGADKNGRLRIWAHGSWVEDGKRYGSYCDWEKSILQNYEVLPEQMSREAYEKWKREYLAYPKPKED